MNGEIVNIIKLASVAKNYIKGKKTIFPEDKYIDVINFFIIEEPTLINKIFSSNESKYKLISTSIEEWLSYLTKSKVTDINASFGNPLKQDVNISGFANANNDWIIRTSRNNDFIVWLKRWEFNEQSKKWTVNYYGHRVEQAYQTKNYNIEDTSIEVNKALQQIKDLALLIGENFWADYFNKAINILDTEVIQYNVLLPKEYPIENHKLLSAISKGWCFGGMGSWNDSPPYAAYQHGLEEEFNNITGQLYNSFLTGIEVVVNSY